MRPAAEVMAQNNGAITAAYYNELGTCGPAGQIAVALFRAQKRSSRAKDYRRGKYRRRSYEVKEWSIGELCRLLAAHGDLLGFVWGWKQDPKVRFGEEPSWVLYIDIRDLGQVSFHCPSRGAGPDYIGEWDGEHTSAERIMIFCDEVAGIPAKASGADAGRAPGLGAANQGERPRSLAPLPVQEILC